MQGLDQTGVYIMIFSRPEGVPCTKTESGRRTRWPQALTAWLGGGPAPCRHYKKYAHAWHFLRRRWWIRHKSMTISSKIVVNYLRGSNLHINYDDVSQKRRNRIRWDRHNFYDDYKNVVTCSNYVGMSLVGPLYPTSSMYWTVFYITFLLGYFFILLLHWAC